MEFFVKHKHVSHAINERFRHNLFAKKIQLLDVRRANKWARWIEKPPGGGYCGEVNLLLKIIGPGSPRLPRSLHS
ncbi:hypothetical protein C8E17_3639 [Serratia plymuthica]|uniref:Uncharacterized protein n=1 Tax=Serratia plymuthica TaxID=82996 RepID=A0A2X4UJ73_SERPL|nr:hypothetical protein C8E17_3639 [Serratia plymuthica]CAI2444565.1 Uncharacterised protein [Serratia plymuthica]SQI35618.1 Uncharacterised protein [Serratia plymuthica]